MSNRRVSDLTLLAGASIAQSDELYIVDVSATVGSRSKRTTVQDLALAIAGGSYQPASAKLDSLASLTYPGNELKNIRVNAAGTGFELAATASGFDGSFSSLTGVPTTLAGYGITDAQAKDLTLTNLASQNWVQNSVPVGSGVDTVAQLPLTTNTVLGRASTGNVAAKTVTDFAFGLLDDADAATMRTTLGVDPAGSSTLTAADEASDSTCFPLFATSATGTVTLKTNSALTFNSATVNLGCTTFTGALVGNASTATTVTTNANLTGDVTSVGNATTIGTGKVTNSMLAGSIAASKLVGTDIATVGTVTAGTWHGTILETAYGGTGVDNSTGGTANQFWARPNGATGAATYRAIVVADVPTLNQNTTGSAATLTTTRTIGGSNFNGSADVTSFPSPGAIGGTTPAAGTFTALTGTSGSITGLTTLAIRDTSAAFDVTLAATSSTTLTAGRTLTLDLVNAARTLKLTGNPTLADWFDQSVKAGASPTFVTVTASLNGNASTVTTNANLTGPITSVGNATSIASQTGTGTTFAMSASPTFTGNPAAPTQTPGDNSTKLATTGYVDAAVLGQNFKEAAKYATTAALPTVVYSNGSSGVGATLTGVALGALSIDSNTPSVGDRVLVKNQASTFQNGFYTVTTVGSGAAVFVLTRATDGNQSFEWKTGDSALVTSGTLLASTTWAYSGVDSPVMGTDAITFSQTAGPGTITSGNGITVTGLSIAIDTSVTADKTTAQVLTNKTISGANNTLTARIANDVSGLGTGVATALAINVGSAGAFVTFNGALGTPSGGTATNLTGTAAGLTAGNATVAATVTVADESADTSCFFALVTDASGSLAIKTNGAIKINSATGEIFSILVNDLTVNDFFQAAGSGLYLGTGTDTLLARSAPGQITVAGKSVPLNVAYACNGRLTTETGVAVSTSDRTAQGTIYWTATSGGNQIALYDGSTTWNLVAFASDISLALTLTSGKNYDVFVYNNSGTATLELSAAWTNDTTRADALTTQNGVYVKSGATTRRYVGTIRASGTNTTEDSLVKRFVWNLYNREDRPVMKTDTTSSWTYTTDTWRQARAQAANQVEAVVGLTGMSKIDLSAMNIARNSTAGPSMYCGIGEDSTSAIPATGLSGVIDNPVTGANTNIWFHYKNRVSIGYHFWAWLERSQASGTTTWFGENSGVARPGIHGTITC